MIGRGYWLSFVALSVCLNSISHLIRSARSASDCVIGIAASDEACSGKDKVKTLLITMNKLMTLKISLIPCII